MAAYKGKRDWTQSTISKAHDTRELTRHGGGHGNAGSLTFSIAVTLGTQFLDRFCNGEAFTRVKMEVGANEILLIPAKSEEVGRKFSLSTYGHDYRVFFDSATYPWIDAVPAFSATVTPAKLTERGILMLMPPEKDRLPIAPYTQYRPRQIRRAYPPTPHLPVVHTQLAEVLAPSNGHLYLVMVPPETDEQFHTLLRFLKLEALRE